jgi:hypothetical protein
MSTSAKCKAPGCCEQRPCDTCKLIAFWVGKRATGEWTLQAMAWRKSKGKS